MSARSCAAVAGPLLASVAGGTFAQRPFALRFWDGSELPAANGGAPVVEVRDPRAIAHLLHEPNQLGLARAWVSGGLGITGDLEPLLSYGATLDGVGLSRRERARVAAAAVRVLGRRALRPPATPASERMLRGARHSLRRDAEAVRHHYDVPAAFYRQVLGPTMVYSCAYFAQATDTLEQAQERKLDVICSKLRLRPGDRLIDIGCGWGSLAIHAARRFGARVVAVTVSPAQAEVARRRAVEGGVAGACEFRVADYREVTDGPYDAVASVGMYEHVGREQLAAYMQTARRLLRPGGLFLNHGIVRLDEPPPDDKRFIGRYVFPDGELHSIANVIGAMEGAGLELRDVESLREHYTLTLRHWVANLAANRDAAIAAGGEEVERIWRLYMTAAAAAFDRGAISVEQALAVNPGAPHRLPLSRVALVPGRPADASAADDDGALVPAPAGDAADGRHARSRPGTHPRD